MIVDAIIVMHNVFCGNARGFVAYPCWRMRFMLFNNCAQICVRSQKINYALDKTDMSVYITFDQIAIQEARMAIFRFVWTKTPVIVRAILLSLLVLITGNMIWPFLFTMNFKTTPSIPWASVVMALYLWGYWRYWNGAGWPRATSTSRRINMQARGLSGRQWASALAAGILAIACAFSLQLAFAQIVRLPAEKIPDFAKYPAVTILFTLLISAAVAGITEETAFRGYMQGIIARRHGPVAASLIVAAAFAMLHFSHGWSRTLPRLPYYAAVSLIYSSLVFLSGSILPGLVIHVAGDLLEFLIVWRVGLSKAKPFVWQTGPGAALLIKCGLAVLFAIAARFAYKRLGAARSSAPSPGESQSQEG